MKKLIPLFFAAALVTACNQSPKIESAQADAAQQTAVSNLDTIGLAQYQNWKAQNELIAMEEEMPTVAKATSVKRTTPKTSSSRSSASSSNSTSERNSTTRETLPSTGTESESTA